MTVVELNDKNFKAEINNASTPVIIDFFASWCGPCKMMAPVFEEISNDYTGKLKFAKLSTEDYPNLAMQYDIRSIPCLIITKNGKEINRIVGFSPKSSLKKEIDSILSSLK